MNDTMSKEKAADLLDNLVGMVDDTNGNNYDTALRIGIEALKTVRHGHWYKPTGMMPPEYVGVYRCSECDEFAMRDWKRYKQILTKWCPHCGALMDGEQHE